MKQALRVGISGPAGSGKTTLTLRLCEAMKSDFSLALVVEDLGGTDEVAIQTRYPALAADRIRGLKSWDSASILPYDYAATNLTAVEELNLQFPDLDIVLIQSTDHFSTSRFRPQLSDLTIYVVDVANYDEMFNSGGLGVTLCDLLVINKTDLALSLGRPLETLAEEVRRLRGDKPFILTSMQDTEAMDYTKPIIEFICDRGLAGIL